MITIREAVRISGRSRATINRAIRSGLLSAQRDQAGGTWQLDPAELARVWPEAAHDYGHGDDHDQVRSGHGQGHDHEAIRLRDQIIAAHEQTIADLRSRLDEEREDRRQALDRLAEAQARITALLTDQRPATPAASLPRRRWWHWR